MLGRFLRAAYGGRAWARLLYAIVGAPLALFGLGWLMLMLYPGVLLAVTLVGLPWLACWVVASRGMGAVHRWLAGWLLQVRVPAPDRFARRPGFIGFVRSGLADAVGWRVVLYLLLKVPFGVVGGIAAAAFWGYGLALFSYPLWWRYVTNVSDAGVVHRGFGGGGDYYFDTWPRILAVAAAGAVLLLIAPGVTWLVVQPDRLLLRLLRPTRSSGLVEARRLAVDDSAATLRRIERDLHDGAQAQLVALAMHLGLAKEELGDGDTAAALALVDTAHQGAKQAIVELRDLARGIHPPVLDSGLEPALQTLASRCVVPVTLRVDLTDRPAPAIETIAYFTVAELLTNVGKHSRAGRVTLAVRPLRPGWLRLVVHDDGIGGARAARGLTGLADRVRSVDGRFELSSPPGGPTVVTVDLPERA